MGRQIRAGVLGGLAGGIVFGMLMWMMGMLPMIAGMVGSASPAVGFLLHLLISAMIGVGFGILLDAYTITAGRATITGLLYGMVWWIVGPLILMPLMMGMGLGSQWNAAAIKAALPSLMGHLIYGGILGFTYFRLAQRDRTQP